MRLEKPQIGAQGTALQRVEALERYLYRLVSELEAELEALEEQKGEDHEEGL